MANDRRELAADLGELFARAVLKQLPEAEAIVGKGRSAYVDGKVKFLRDRSGRLRCHLTVSSVKAAYPRAEKMVVVLNEGQLALFGG